MDLYRIGPRKYLEGFSGKGASYENGARWNRPGFPVIYYSCSPATAMLEMANYLPSPRLVPKDYCLAHYKIVLKKSEYDVLDRSKCPANWNASPYPITTQQIGSDWLEACEKVLLVVPSAAVAAGLENNAIFNPLHAKASKIKLLNITEELYHSEMFLKL